MVIQNHHFHQTSINDISHVIPNVISSITHVIPINHIVPNVISWHYRGWDWCQNLWICFTSPKQISVGDCIPKSWVMSNWDIETNPWRFSPIWCFHEGVMNVFFFLCRRASRFSNLYNCFHQVGEKATGKHVCVFLFFFRNPGGWFLCFSCSLFKIQFFFLHELYKIFLGWSMSISIVYP